MLFASQVSGGVRLMRRTALVVAVSLLIVGAMLSFYLWRWAIPQLSYDVVRIPMNELQDAEWLDVVGEVAESELIFSQRLETYCGAEDLLRLEMDVQGNVITITEIFDSGDVEPQICPYDLHGRIKPLPEGTYILRVIFMDKNLNRTETLHEKTVSFAVKLD